MSSIVDRNITNKNINTLYKVLIEYFNIENISEIKDPNL